MVAPRSTLLLFGGQFENTVTSGLWVFGAFWVKNRTDFASWLGLVLFLRRAGSFDFLTSFTWLGHSESKTEKYCSVAFRVPYHQLWCYSLPVCFRAWTWSYVKLLFSLSVWRDVCVQTVLPCVAVIWFSPKTNLDSMRLRSTFAISGRLFSHDSTGVRNKVDIYRAER